MIIPALSSAKHDHNPSTPHQPSTAARAVIVDPRGTRSTSISKIWHLLRATCNDRLEHWLKKRFVRGVEMPDKEGDGTAGGDGVIPNIQVTIHKDETRQEKTGDSIQGSGERRDRGAAPA